MNIPVFCRILGNVCLKEISTGSLVYDIINAAIDDTEKPFSYEMTGDEMYNHYRNLTPRNRLALEDIQPLTVTQWQELVRETETQSSLILTNDYRSGLYVNMGYAAIITFCYMVATLAFVGYVANLNYNDESMSSTLVQIFTDVVVEIPEQGTENVD